MFDVEEEGLLPHSNNSNHSSLVGRHARGNYEPVLKAVAKISHAFIQLFTPSFCHRSPGYHNQVQQPRRATSYLDGLRGYAAVASFVFYGYDIHDHNLWFHQLPIVRLFYTGTWPISVFFPLKESRKRAEVGVGDPSRSVASSLIRRPVRLYGLPIISSFVTMLVIYLGAFEDTIAINETHPARLPSFASQLSDWAHETWRMLNIFWWGDLHNRYDVHLWTISTEFPYVVIQPRIRKLLLSGLILYVYALDRWDVGLFFAGVLIADTSFSVAEYPVSSQSKDYYKSSAYTAALALLFGLSLWLLSAPDFCVQTTPGFQSLSRLIPSSDPAPFRFIPNLGGILLVAILTGTGSSNSLVSVFLDSAVPQYLGRISYSLYIVHGPLMHTLGYWLFSISWSFIGAHNTRNYVTGFSIAYVLFVSITIWTADLVCRTIDEPCVRLAKAIQQRISL
ncbi:acyltransferase family-domain-containing protein [Xylaria arbuscula]|nr:acyltransferase family-domain-containing protein [Xylaria arbuscula]